MKDFNTIIKESLSDSDGRYSFYKNEVLELMKIVRKETIKECAKQAIFVEDKSLILSLDKNSIDL